MTGRLRPLAVVVAGVFWPLRRLAGWVRASRRVQQGFDAGATTARNAHGVEAVVVFYTVGGRRHSFGFAADEASEHATNILGAVAHARRLNKARAGGAKKAIPKGRHR